MPLPEHEDKHGADGFLKKLCPIFGKIRRIEEPQGCYRIHPGSYGGGRGVMFKLRRGLMRYPTYCENLARHLRRMGVNIVPSTWMGPGSQYEWLKNVVDSYDEIADLIPEGEKLTLIDDNALGQEFLPGREVLPFIERAGQYWGPPHDDRQAIQELERMKAEGVRFVVFAFPGFWWLDVYEEFYQFVHSHFDCLRKNERLIVFDLHNHACP